MFEKPPFEYASPYIIYNPFRVTLSIKNFERNPASPFEFLWTIKNFPATTVGDDRYVKGLPNGVEGIEKSILSNNIPVFPDQISKIKIEWMHGIARFLVNQQLAGEINYQPFTYNPKNLRVVFGKTPGVDSFDSPDLVFFQYSYFISKTVNNGKSKKGGFFIHRTHLFFLFTLLWEDFCSLIQMYY